MMLFEQAFWLITLHFVADFHLQSDFIARNKVQGSSIVWPWVLTAHSALHGAVVGYILNPFLGLAEFVAHWIIDHSKGLGWLGRNQMSFVIDQVLHIGLKLVWLGLSLLVPTPLSLF